MVSTVWIETHVRGETMRPIHIKLPPKADLKRRRKIKRAVLKALNSLLTRELDC